MAAPSWDDTTEIPPSWEDTVPHPGASGTAPGSLEALLRGGAQGATLGFGDEIQGGGHALFDKLLGQDGGKSLGDLYSQHVEEARAANEAAQKAHPYLYGAGNVAGGLASGLATGGLGAETALGRIGAAGLLGAAGGVGYGNAGNVQSGVADAIKGAAVGGAFGTVAEGAGSILSGGASKALADKAEGLAENATGATGAQMQRFQPGAGRALLDRGIVGFGDSQSAIAEKATDALQKSGKGIEDSLKGLDAKGVTVDRNTVINYIKSKIAGMSNDESKADLVRSLQGKLGDIEAQLPSDATELGTAGESAAEAPLSSEVPISQAENIKRGYQGKVNWKSSDLDNNSNALVSDAYRDVVEKTAQNADPGLAKQFTDAKADYHLLAPIQEAAERRAAVTAQSPPGGLLDTASVAAGMASGNPALAVAAPVARRAVASRIASSSAVGADKLADILRVAPETLGPWASQLAAAAARGGSSLGATNYILSQTNSEYRQHMKKVLGSE